MQALFHSRHDLLVRTEDGRQMVLEEPCEVVVDGMRRFRAPIGSSTDGASTPRPFWSMLPPDGPWWLAAVIHDAGYRNTLEEWNGEEWKPSTADRTFVDDLFLALMVTLGVSEQTRLLIYEAVRMAGEHAWHQA